VTTPPEQKVAFFEWSPTDASLLFVADDGALFRWSPPDQPDRIADAGIYSAQWSPDGTRIAYAVRTPGSSRDDLVTVSLDAEHPGPPYVGATKDGDIGLDLARWSPNQERQLTWIDPAHSASLAADGLDLVSWPTGTEGAVVTLGTMIPDPRLLAWSPDAAQLAFVSGTGRFLGDRKVIRICGREGDQCRDLPQPPDQSTVDVSWSPDGRQLAVTRGPALTGADPDYGNTVAFNQRRRLVLVDATDGTTHDLPGSAADLAARRPRWLGSDRVIVETDAGLEVVDLRGGTAQLVTPPVDEWDVFPSVPTGPPPSTTTTSSPAASETPAEVLARTVTGADPLLLPKATPGDWRTETTARWDSFEVRYSSPERDRSISVSISQPNPNPDWDKGHQGFRSFRGDSGAVYGVYDGTDPHSRRWVLWREPGRWDPGSVFTPSSAPGVPYYIVSEGLSETEFWQYADSLEPVALTRPAHAMISVAPDTGLRDGQTVQVTLQGFPAGSKVYLSQCDSAGSANPFGCGRQVARQPFALPDDSGAASTSFTVADAAAGKPFESAPTEPCTNQCVLVAEYTAPNAAGDGAYVAVVIEFSPR
jgi:hypothetical protein